VVIARQVEEKGLGSTFLSKSHAASWQTFSRYPRRGKPFASISETADHTIKLETAMNPTTETLSAQAVQLPPEERMALVERILDSLDEPDASLDALWAKEADDRLAAYRRGEIRAVALSDVVAKYQVTKKPE
jgi:putative addiction module component (TIGR02574 family)